MWRVSIHDVSSNFLLEISLQFEENENILEEFSVDSQFMSLIIPIPFREGKFQESTKS